MTQRPRVLVIGLDGFEKSFCDALMADGALTIHGILRDGLRVAAQFTELPWVREQFQRKLGLDVYPGTVNLQVQPPKAPRPAPPSRPPSPAIAPATRNSAWLMPRSHAAI